MRKRYSKERKNKVVPTINVIPYVDVCLVLLIIFLVTSPALQYSITVDLPESLNSKAIKTISETDPVLISIDAAGKYLVQDYEEVVEFSDLKTVIANLMAKVKVNPNSMLYIQGDTNVAYGKVVQLFQLLKHYGVKKVSLLTNLENQ